MGYGATFNNISVISWRSVLLVEETGVPGKTTDLPLNRLKRANINHIIQQCYIESTKRCEFESRSGEVYSIQRYVIKFVRDCGRSVVFPGTPVSSTNKTERHDITEILLKVAP
jgi:hypothetical protein